MNPQTEASKSSNLTMSKQTTLESEEEKNQQKQSMTSIGVVLAVKNRLKLLVSYKTGPGSKPESFVQPVERLISKLDDIQVLQVDNRGLYDKAMELAYEVESFVESLYLQQVEQPKHDDHHTISLKTKQFTKIIGLARTSSKSADKITTTSPVGFQNLMSNLDDLIKRFGNVSQKIGDTEKGSTSSHPNTTIIGLEEDIIGCTSSHPNPTIIGLDEDISTLQDQLKDGSGTRTISIVGMAGIGKTTLARKLFDLTEYNRAWVHVGDKFHARDVAVSIFQQLTCWECSSQEIQSMDTTELIERIYKAQQGKRCLVVLDDVWSNNAWDTIRLAFPSDHGARIIITTRDKPIASSDGYIHEMSPLDDDQTWELFIAQQSQQDLDAINQNSEEERTNIRSKVVELSRKLPLDITILGGMMRGNWFDWPEKLQTSSSLESEDTSRSLYLSYKNLPFQLKECFLYLGLFTEDRVVPVDKLYLMWMSEWLIPPRHHQRDDKTRMDTAQSYLNELVQRRLVMTMQKKDLAAGKMVESCELHDLVRNTCLSEGIKEGFIRTADQEKRKLSPMLRIAIDLDNHESPHNKINPDAKHVRSILFFETVGFQGKSSAKPVEVANLNEYQQSARVLDFDGVNFQSRKLPKGIEKLEYLRYIGFRGCHLEELPSTFNKFPFLETLDLRVVTSCKMTIPNILGTLSCLLHLFFPLYYQGVTTTDKLKLEGLKRLETLVNFHAGICNVDDLKHLQNLRNFIGIADANNEEVTGMIKFIKENNHLSPSSLTLRKYDCYSEERFEIFKQVLTADSIQALDIEGHLGKLPSDTNWGKHITEMIFNGSEFQEDPMPILGKIPCLTSLVLCNDAFLGNKMVCTKENFPKLTYLKLSNLWALEELVVEFGAMSCLSTLKLQKCRKLQDMSPYLIKIATLQEVKIRQMSQAFLSKLKDIPRAAKWLPITL